MSSCMAATLPRRLAHRGRVRTNVAGVTCRRRRQVAATPKWPRGTRFPQVMAAISRPRTSGYTAEQMSKDRRSGTGPWIASRYRVARREAARHRPSGDSSECPDAFLVTARGFSSSEDAADEIRALAHAIEAIHQASSAADPTVWRSVVEEAECLAISLTQRLGIKPRKSRAAGLFTDIFHATGQYHRVTGNRWQAAWDSLIAISFDVRRRPPRHVDIDAGALALASTMEGPRKVSDDDAARVRDLRLRGDHLEALAYADRALIASEANPTLRWEHALCEVHLCASTEPLRRWRRRGEAGQEHAACLMALYARAVPATTEARMFTAPDGVTEAHRVTRIIHDLYNVTIPMEDRLRRLGSALYSLSPRVEQEIGLVFLAAAARWLHRRQHTPLYVLVETAYRTLSQSFSEGRTADVLGLVSDMGVTRGRRSKQRDDSLCVYPDWGRRTGYTAAIVARLAAELGIARVRGLFAPGHRQRRLQGGERDHMLGVVTSHLGRMKGPLMKMAQHVGYLGLDLPHDIDYHRGLRVDSAYDRRSVANCKRRMSTRPARPRRAPSRRSAPNSSCSMSAAASLDEGLEETLTLHRLGLFRASAL